MAKFWGHLFLINFAVGVVTGILQEFQFGMNWSEYSRFVGDVFGAPLAVEAVARFLYGIDVYRFVDLRLGPPSEEDSFAVHLACFAWHDHVGVLDSSGQLVYAGACRICDQKRTRGNDRFFCDY